MAPNVLKSKEIKSDLIKKNKLIKVKNKLRKYQKFIKNNFKCGENFANEAEYSL